MADPAGRFSIAFDDPALEWDATWTRLDDTDNLVASYTIERGRQYELDRTDAGTATVRINDKYGVLDPTNTGGDYYGKIEPLLQAAICRWNPVLDEWQTRFRGWIEDFDYRFDPSQRINFLEVSLVDIFERLSAIEMLPDGTWGDPPPNDSGQVWFESGTMDGRIEQVLGDPVLKTNARIPSGFYVVFTGNVDVIPTSYSPGESPMTAIQEAADAEFPGVSNVYTDRFGRLAVHGRLAKFDPATIAAGAGDAAWDWHHWHAGDGAAVAASPSTVVQLRRFAFNRGLSKVINSAHAYPMSTDEYPVTDEEIAANIEQDGTSMDLRGIRSWSAPNLLTLSGLADSSTRLVETKRFAEYYVANYAEPRNRVTDIAFRSMHPSRTGAAINWRLLSEIDIADQISVNVASPGGGGFEDEEFFVEGIREEVTPLVAEYDNVTLSLDLSPIPIDTSMFPAS